MVAAEAKTRLCKIHGEYPLSVIKVLGTEIERGCPHCTKEQREKERLEAIRAETHANALKIENGLNIANIPPRYRNLDFKPKSAQMRAIFEVDSNLLVTGGVGTGKTAYVSYLARKWIEKGESVRYMLASELIGEIRESWGKQYTCETKVIRELSTCDWLILDEIGRCEYSDYLFRVIDGRYQNGKYTVVIGNIEASEIPRILGEAIASRLRENIKAVNFGKEDLRHAKREQNHHSPDD